jgi:hypothetical protein
MREHFVMARGVKHIWQCGCSQYIIELLFVSEWPEEVTPLLVLVLTGHDSIAITKPTNGLANSMLLLSLP